MTSSNENNFSVTGPLCGEFTGPGEFPVQRPVTRSFGVFFDLRPNKRLSKQPWGWRFETSSWSLWSQCNEASLKPPKHWSKVLCFSAFFLSGFSVRQVIMNDTAKISHYLIITKFNITWRGINHVHNFEMYYITLPRGGALQHPISVPSYGLSRDALGSRYRISCYSYMQGALYCNILRHLTRLFWNDT